MGNSSFAPQGTVMPLSRVKCDDIVHSAAAAADDGGNNAMPHHMAAASILRVT